jgi:tryptophan-rich sensory protein
MRGSPLHIIIEEFCMAKRTEIDKLGWLVNLILTIFFDPLVQGINRILRGKVIIGILWILTGGIIGIGWIIDIITMLFKKDITFLA